MAILPLVTATTKGLAILRAPAPPVAEPSIGELRPLARDLVESMHAHHGIGLAANQVGRTERIAVIAHADGDLVVVNPRIRTRSIRRETGEEGCLSLPGVFGMVRRARSVTVEYRTLDGTRVVRRASGLLARIFQHEIDHLDGLLFADHAKAITHGSVPDAVYASRPAAR